MRRGTPLADTVRRLARKLALRDRERYGAEIAARDRMRLAALERAKDLVGTGRAADSKERTGPH
ncbi:hypothetical protein D7M15_07150 [Streptomyces sp. Z26]|nr:hypothetical protein D7M15_07150 [Streptomyces sp. Z26]